MQKTTSFALLKTECSKIEVFRKSDKGLVLLKCQKWPKYRNSIGIVHFEENFILIKNLWMTRDFDWSKVVKIIKTFDQIGLWFIFPLFYI